MNLTAAQRAAVAELAAAAQSVDGAGPYSEQSRLALAQDLPAGHVFREAPDGTLAGYAQIWVDASAELAVHPDHRRQGHGRALLAEALGAGAVRFWSYAGHPAAGLLADEVGLKPVRELWRMRAPLPLDPDPEPALQAGIWVRTFEVGRDEDAWLAANAAAFAGHAEQGRLTRAELDARIGSDWFDAAGFFLAERDGRLVGFHWTKVAGVAGEIYVLGVDPAAHGGGLGSALARVGLRHLAARGLATALLYVDAGNAAAVAVYRRMGFDVEAASVLYGP